MAGLMGSQQRQGMGAGQQHDTCGIFMTLRRRRRSCCPILTSARSCRNRPLLIKHQQARALLSIQEVDSIHTLLAEQSSSGSSLTWQVAVGTIGMRISMKAGVCYLKLGFLICVTAGITPFVVAGIEFSKRIAAQKKCTVCKGSGLVKRDEYYFRCYSCGGFLPWQSWRRFFSGR